MNYLYANINRVKIVEKQQIHLYLHLHINSSDKMGNGVDVSVRHIMHCHAGGGMKGPVGCDGLARATEWNGEGCQDYNVTDGIVDDSW